MAFLSDNNKEIAQPYELGVFSLPPNNVAIEKVYFAQCRPISSITGADSPVEIVISGQGREYLDLRRTKLFVKAKISKPDGSDISATEQVGIINLPLHSIWSQVDVYTNGKLVSTNTNNFPWKSYIKCILSHGYAASTSQLQSQLFYKDDTALDDTNVKSGSNNGFFERNKFTAESKYFDLEGTLFEDIFGIDKYLIKGVSLYIKLYRASSKFIFLSGETSPAYVLQIADVYVNACKVRVDPGIVIAHSNELEIRPVQYFLTRTEMKCHAVPKNSGDLIWDSMFSNAIPNKLIVGFISQVALNGDYVKNPFNFQHFFVTEVALYINGESVPGQPLTLDFETNNTFVSAFVNIFEGAEIWNKNNGLIISRKDFSKGYALYVFTLNPTDLGDQYISLVRHGNVRLQVKFGKPTAETLSCLAYAEFPAILEIDKTREIRYIQ